MSTSKACGKQKKATLCFSRLWLPFLSAWRFPVAPTRNVYHGAKFQARRLPLRAFLTMSMECVASFPNDQCAKSWTCLWCSSTGIVPFLYPDFQFHVVQRRGSYFGYSLLSSWSRKWSTLQGQSSIYPYPLHSSRWEDAALPGRFSVALPRDLAAKNLTVEVALTDFELGIPQPCRANVTSKILGSNHDSQSAWDWVVSLNFDSSLLSAVSKEGLHRILRLWAA